MKYLTFVAVIILVSCSSVNEENTVWKSIEADLQTLLIQANDGDTVRIPAGNYMFKRSLIIDGLTDVVITGAGMDETRISFQLQESGAEGIKAANCTNLVFQDFTIQDSKGDNIKVTDTQGVKFSRIRSMWTGEPKKENGAYAFYPVLSKNVIIENCVAIGSSDAGIYVGQSDSVIIRNNEAYWNVAGIESENSRWVEIYGNNAHENTGGILIFDLPGLTQSGHTTRVFDNEVISNNYENFAPEGNIVASVPPGTGIMMMATRNIEVFNNRIHNNRTIGATVVSYELVEALGAAEGSQMEESIAEVDNSYDPYPNQISIHDNEFKNEHWFPTLQNDFGLLFLKEFTFGTPDFAIDGIFPKDKDFVMCLEGNGEFKFANLDAANDFEGLTTSWEEFNCSIDPLAAIFRLE